MRTLTVLVVLLALSSPALGQEVDRLVLSEVCYDVAGGDDGLEWVEFFNGYADTVQLCEYRLAWGGLNYIDAQVQLEGAIPPGSYFVVGGPTSSSLNGEPAFDLILNFDPDLQNSGLIADAVALFHLGYQPVDVVSQPIDAVIYGDLNENGLIDEFGSMEPDVGDAPAGQTLGRASAESWMIQSVPTPGTGPLIPTGGSAPPSVACLAPPPPPDEIRAFPLDSLGVDYRVQFHDFGYVPEPTPVDTVVSRPGLRIGERLDGQFLRYLDPDTIEGTPISPLTVLPGDAGYNLYLQTRPPEATGTDVLVGATLNASALRLGGSVAVVFDEDQSQVGLELLLYSPGKLYATFYDRRGLKRGAVTLELPDTPYDTPFATAFTHRADSLVIAGMTLEFQQTTSWGGFGIEALTLAPPDGTDASAPPDVPGIVLHGNHPNPFNPSTTISYSVIHDGPMALDIFDLGGRHVRTLFRDVVTAGEHSVQWNGKNDAGDQVASGVYLYRLNAGDFVATKRMVLLK